MTPGSNRAARTRRHPWAPLAAIAIGLSSAIGFTAAHLLPHLSSSSDPFTGNHVAPVSWLEVR